MTGGELHIPEAAKKAACDAYDAAVRSGTAECEEIVALRGAAPLIVTAELRSLAERFEHKAWAGGTALRARAAELDPAGAES